MGESNSPARPKGPCAEHCIEIDAPAEAVWEVIKDFDGWARWNPLYIETNGSLQPGQSIQFTVSVPGMKPQKGGATVYSVTPPWLLEYGLVNLGGLLRAFRFVDIHQTGPDRCTVSNGEIMSGPIGQMLGRVLGERVRQGLQGMNEALKKLVEAA